MNGNNNKTTAEVLREARELISDPKRWTRGVLARDAEGRSTGRGPFVPEAVCFCAFGAIAKVEGRYGGPAAVFIEREAGFDAEEGNDGGAELSFDTKPRPAPAQHRKVLAAFDRAIALAEEAA